MAVITTYSGTPANSVRVSDTVVNQYEAQQFTATASGTITNGKFWHRVNDGTPTDGVTVQIWSDNGSNSPNALITGATVNIAQASIVDGGNSYDVAEFTAFAVGTPAAVVNGTKYWVVIFRQGANDAVNYNNLWVTNPSSYVGGLHKTGTSGLVWSDIGVSMATQVTIDVVATAGNFLGFM